MPVHGDNHFVVPESQLMRTVNMSCRHPALIGRIRSEEMYAQVLSAFQATPRKTIIAENSIHTIKPIAAASPP
jgi:hypothetical protein